MGSESALHVDQHEIKFAMAATLLLLALSWVLNSWIPVAIAAICQLIGATGSPYAPYFLIYRRVTVPVNLIKPHIIPDDPIPHRFASLIGGLLTLLGAIFLWANYSLVGWIFASTVFALQILNFFVNFSMMYYLYHVLNRLGVPGFTE